MTCIIQPSKPTQHICTINYQIKKQKIMKVKIGAFDGWFRTLLFLVSLCYAVLVGGSAWFWVIPTSILFVTVVLMWCPLYEMFGINTNTDKDIHL